MKHVMRLPELAGVFVAMVAASGCACHPVKPTMAVVPPKAAPIPAPDPMVTAMLQDLDRESQSVQSMSADFSYAVTSARQQQLITGKVLLMKPNYMRITYSYMAHSAFPNPIASDGEKIYTFTPERFHRVDPFDGGPFDPTLGAREASGLVAGGGAIRTDRADATGQNLHLWDSIAIQSFFSPDRALGYLYYDHVGELKNEGSKTIDGVSCRVLSHHFENGEIAGGERSKFDQHVYVGPENLIRMYLLEFTSSGNRGVQVMHLTNIQVNLPLTREDFAFTPPATTASAK